MKKDIKSFILSQISDHPSDIIQVITNEFKISRQIAHRHLSRLIKTGEVLKTGKTRSTKYYLPSEKKISGTYSLTSELHEDIIWKKEIAPFLQEVPKNILDICYYGFTEILNNAIDHSEGKNIIYTVEFTKNNLEISLLDNGIGIFKKIAEKFQLSTFREAILHLAKGKLTTDPKKHTGEGIFFTSRIFDEFSILSSDIAFLRYNEDDWSFEKRESSVGTFVSMKISLESKKTVKEIFEKYTNPETYTFDRTVAIVDLSKNDDEVFISRSQAKRVLVGLEKFKKIILDFKGVRSVGQGFVDEIFRVFKNEYPDIEITYDNANEDIIFMIERGLS